MQQYILTSRVGKMSVNEGSVNVKFNYVLEYLFVKGKVF